MAAKTKPGKKPARGSRQASRKPNTGAGARQRSPVIWGITGLAMGLMVALVVHLEHTRPDQPAGGDATDGSANDATAGGASDQPRFEFYRLLSEQEVEVASRGAETLDNNGALPDADDPASDTATQSTESELSDAGAPEATDGARYLLQAGSFRKPSDAESLKASLALLGIEARIQVVELPGGETWHRVRIGPFADLQRVNAVRERMAGQQIDAILLRAGG
ncbi:SPOR domain-containing protein [Spiribacter sp. 221]|uniref:SPOR domain-containing protein n=1 Tax=Spiribacter onubensis TaxID=3122420 RepID=UPI00349FAFE4